MTASASAPPGRRRDRPAVAGIAAGERPSATLPASVYAPRSDAVDAARDRVVREPRGSRGRPQRAEHAACDRVVHAADAAGPAAELRGGEPGQSAQLVRLLRSPVHGPITHGPAVGYARPSGCGYEPGQAHAHGDRTPAGAGAPPPARHADADRAAVRVGRGRHARRATRRWAATAAASSSCRWSSTGSEVIAGATVEALAQAWGMKLRAGATPATTS